MTSRRSLGQLALLQFKIQNARGSAGIGFATAKALYSEGVSVAIVARNPEHLEKAANAIRELPDRGNKVITIAADLTQAESVETVVSKT